MFCGGRRGEQDPKPFRRRDTHNHFTVKIRCQNQLTRFLKGKQRRRTLYQKASVSLFVLHTLPVCEVFTCNCLHSGEQRKFLSSPHPARPSLPACSTEDPHTGPITVKCTHRAVSVTTHLHTSIGAAQEIPELHVGSWYTEDRTSAKSHARLRSSRVSTS